MNLSTLAAGFGWCAPVAVTALGLLAALPGSADEQKIVPPPVINAPEQLPSRKQPPLGSDAKEQDDIPIDEKSVPSDASDAPADRPARVTKEGKIIEPARPAVTDTDGKEAPEKDMSAIPTAQPISPAALDNSQPVHQPNQTFTSLSASKQFIVRGKDVNLTSAISTRADEIRSGLLSLMKLPNTWKDNIFINLHGNPGTPPPANPIRMGIDLIETKPNYYINLHVGRGIDLDALYNAVTTMLLYEIMLRDINPDGLPERISLPQWLLTGIEQAVQWKNDQADRNLYATLFERGEILSPKAILSIKDPWKELDATSLLAYKASCGSIVLCLLNQKAGEEAMFRLLNEAILGSDDPENLIKRNFPRLNLTPTSLHKWWSLQLSTMATPAVTEALSLQNTEKKLDELLVLLKYDPETRISTRISLSNLEEALKIPNVYEQLSATLNNLSYLHIRSFPTYKPLITDYIKIIVLLKNSRVTKEPLDKKSLQERLDKLAKFRALSMQAAIRARDYMDWYEINSRHTLSNTFSSYISAINMLRNPAKSSPTPLSRYLDDIEALYLLPAQAPTPDLSADK
ncbi:hypothetical protein QET93_010980 [Akkermansia sp. N21116]|uniref:hypothetical protein n=1 Tax=Akkermansia sp. N21116 TaxID=3040764 RepID=UPI00244E8234|nr:hypothetical protein [Akkermansia sp. N21116]WPX40054.1 hypothetical protein QET93_010980 [Akkermansia sp. N21116]